MIIRKLFCSAVVTLLCQDVCWSEDAMSVVADVCQDDAQVRVSCKLDHGSWRIGEKITATLSIENKGEAGVRVFDPLGRGRGKVGGMEVVQLELLDQNRQRIGNLFATEGGSAIPPSDGFWILLPKYGICRSQIRCYGAGYVPRTRFSKGRELPPGNYFLRLVVMKKFLLSNYENDRGNNDRLAESKIMPIKLTAQ
ncbi:hypothetical protein K227x_61390 [Rubripirellula lacrimiformis]|uniref:Uncharacterized protein n=2 Tax=Rubripirellula lacrimiformis TaxID=1930273 RepID=A0A517NKQ5_9BACT|nr:hypothetical protein K227x_61390 [Rubripirellula lacrimiformis]